MVSKELLSELLQLGDDWEPTEVHHSTAERAVTIAVKAKPGVWKNQECPHCSGQHIAPQPCLKKQLWRHLDGFSHRTTIECDLPAGKCIDCGHRFTLKPAWQGRNRHFTKSFECFALNLIRETTVRGASRILNEKDHRLWRILFSYVEGARSELSTMAIGILHREWGKSVPIQKTRS